VGTESTAILTYNVNDSGWTDELTEFHESQAGEQHYIDKASRRHALSCLTRFCSNPRPVIMDIGCSSGFMVRDIHQAMPEAYVIGADYVRVPLEKLAVQYPDIPFLQIDITNCPLPEASLDAAVLLNVLEHIEDHETAARSVFHLLKPGGIAVIELPAGPHLYDVYDKQLMHFRRYTLPQVCNLLKGAGFTIEAASHLGFFLYPPFAMVKMRNKRYLSQPDEEQRKIVARSIQMIKSNALMDLIMRIEDAGRYKVPYPVGIRCLAVGRKP
jgi:SAM-dependent methyltransferase